MEKKALLSIGDFSKITGVGIKALRYYDEAGILTPAFVDPDSGYRYYSFHQKLLVDAIQFCVELGIPLKQFPDYTNADEPASWISYADLVGKGEEIVREKMKTLQERLDLLKEMRKEIHRAEESCQRNRPEKYSLPARDCWIVPYEGRQFSRESGQLTNKIILEIHRNNMRLGNTGGLLLLRQQGVWKQFLFVDVHKDSAREKKTPQVIHIPRGVYLCKKVERSGIEQVWDWSRPHVKPERIQLVIETELFVGNYRFSQPVLEQRCLLDSQ